MYLPPSVYIGGVLLHRDLNFSPPLRDDVSASRTVVDREEKEKKDRPLLDVVSSSSSSAAASSSHHLCANITYYIITLPEQVCPSLCLCTLYIRVLPHTCNLSLSLHLLFSSQSQTPQRLNSTQPAAANSTPQAARATNQQFALKSLYKKEAARAPAAICRLCNPLSRLPGQLQQKK